MSEIKVNNANSQNVAQVQPQSTNYVPAYVSAPIMPTINNNNGYLPTYIPSYYTSNYGYQMPYCYTQYPMAQPQATVQAGGTTYQVPQGASGVNIIVNSPTVATPGSQPMINTNTNCYGQGNGNANGGANASANITAPMNMPPKKTKNVVALTNEYIKNLENYLRNPSKDLKYQAISEIAKRFEEDESRKTNPSLNALLNLALQAKEKEVRFIALTLLSTGLAGGNDTTVQLLNSMQQSNAYKGQEANDVKKALLKMSETVVKVPDYSPDKPKKGENDK